MSSPVDGIVLTVADRVATITIARENKRNALAARHFDELAALLMRADADASVHVIVLTGAGDRAFCAGADLSPGEEFFEKIGDRPQTGLGNVLRCARRLTKPLLGRINGDCFAGGVGLLAACDVAIAADHARFALPEAKIGLFPFVVAAGLKGKIAQPFIAELALTALPITAARAERIGLVAHCVGSGQLDATTSSMAAAMASLPRTAIAVGRAALHPTDDLAFETSLAEAEHKTRALSALRPHRTET